MDRGRSSLLIPRERRSGAPHVAGMGSVRAATGPAPSLVGKCEQPPPVGQRAEWYAWDSPSLPNSGGWYDFGFLLGSSVRGGGTAGDKVPRAYGPCPSLPSGRSMAAALTNAHETPSAPAIPCSPTC